MMEQLHTIVGVSMTRMFCFQSRSHSYATTDGQSVSLSWCQAPIWGPRPDFCYLKTVAGFLIWGALSDERTGLSFTIAAGRHQRSHSVVRVPRDSQPYLLSQIRDSSNMGGQVPVFVSPTNRVAQLYSQALCSIFVASYEVEVFEPASTRGPHVLFYTWTSILYFNCSESP
jgi:hypothetical protein